MLRADGKSGGIHMTRLILTIILIVSAVQTDTASATRPTVASPSFLESISRDVSTQRRELRRINRASKDQHPDKRVLDAALEQYLALVETLCNRARRIDGPTGSRLLLAATTLLEGFPDIAILFERFASGQLPETTASAVRSRLISFTRTVRAGLARLPNSTVDHPEEMLVSMLTPLKEACQEAAGEDLPEGWWIVAGSVESTEADDPAADSVSIVDLEIDEELMFELRSLPDGSPLRSSALSLVEGMLACEWMHGGVKRRLFSILQLELGTVRLDKLPEMAIVQRLDAMIQLIEAFKELSESPGGRIVASRNSQSILDFLEPRSDRFPPADSTKALTGTVRTVALIRERTPNGLDGEDARIHARISKQCNLAENRVFDSFGEIARADSPWTDPGMVVVLSEPRNLLESLTWLRELDSWSNRLADLDQAGSERLINGLRNLIAAMVDQSTREDARRALREFERQLEMFILLDQADDYLRGQRAAGGRHADRIGEGWNLWIDDWSNGRSAGEGGSVLYGYRRLLDHLRLIESTDRESLQRVDAWSAWELPIDHMIERREMFTDLIERYSNAIASGDQSTVNRLSIELEHPFSGLRLVGAVSAHTPHSTVDEPALLTIGQVVSVPSHDGLLVEERSRLAVITHALLEIQFLLDQERLEEADALQEWLERETLRLNRRMGLVPARPLAVPGMREEATRIGVDGMQMMQ